MPRTTAHAPDDPSSTEYGSCSLEATAKEALLPGLTVLYHPDLRRLGERTLLRTSLGGPPMPCRGTSRGSRQPGRQLRPGRWHTGG